MSETNLSAANDALAKVIQENQKLRARLDYYEKGRCCVEEPPTKKGLYILTMPKVGPELDYWMPSHKRWAFRGEPAKCKGWRWHPLP